MKQLLFIILFLASFVLHAEQVTAIVGWAQVATLSTPLNGLVASVKVDIGDKVKKGQLLATLDASPLKAELNRAEAVLQGRSSTYEEEKRELERAEELFDRTVLSQTELQAAQLKHSLAKAEFGRAQAEVEQAKINLRYSRVIAPFNGIVVERNVHPGEVVANQFRVTPMLRVARAGRLLATAVISAEAADRLNTGDKVRVLFAGDSYPGKVQQILSENKGNGLMVRIVFEAKGKAGRGSATVDL